MTWRARFGLAFAAVVVALGLAAPAQAAGELGLSPDGVVWGSSLPSPLFDPASRWVPGDSESSSFFVRNQGSEPGILDISMVTGPAEDLVGTGDLDIAVQVDSGPFVSANAPGAHVLASQIPVGSGTVHKVTVRVSLDPESTNISQIKHLDLRFDVTLSQDASVLPPTSGGNGGNGGSGGDGGTVAGPHDGADLPNTGTVITPALIFLAAALCAVGGALVGAGRTSREDTKERQRTHA